MDEGSEDGDSEDEGRRRRKSARRRGERRGTYDSKASKEKLRVNGEHETLRGEVANSRDLGAVFDPGNGHLIGDCHWHRV